MLIAPMEFFMLVFFVAAVIAWIPSCFAKSWNPRSSFFVKADRSLTYCEGWRRCMNGFRKANEASADGVDEHLCQEIGSSEFEEGIAYIEKGKHLSIL
jgi:hypothetical protein